MAGEHQKPYGAQQHQPYVQEAYLDPTYRVEQPYAGPAAQEVTVVGTAVTTQPLPEVIVIEQQRIMGVAGGAPPRTYCFLAWFSCLFCCWPIGLLAVIMSISVSNKMRDNDFQGAYRASRSARKIAVIAIIAGIIMYVTYGTSYVGNSESSSSRSNQSS